MIPATDETPLLFEKKPDQIQFLKGQIILNPEITKLNFFTFLLHSCFMGIVLVPLGLFQVPLMTNVYHLDTDEQATASSIVNLSQLILKLLIAPFLGFFCDKLGRKLFVTVGLFLLLPVIYITPHLPSFYPYYIILQLAQEIGLLCVVMVPLLADYIDDKTKGRVAGLVCILTFAASSISTLIHQSSDLKNNLPVKYTQVAVIGCALATVLMFGVKGGDYYKKHPQQKSEEPVSLEDGTFQTPNDNPLVLNNASVSSETGVEKDKKSKQAQPGFVDAFKEIKNPWIFISFVCSFLMMASINLLGFPFISYLNHLKPDSSNQAIALSSKHFMAVTVSAGFFGFFTDKYNKFRIVLLVVSSSMIGTVLLILLPDPEHIMAYIAMGFFGISTAGLITSNTQLQSKYANPKLRASVGAIGAMFNAAGGALIGILGVFLMRFDVLLPFYMYFGFTFLAIFVLIFTYVSNRETLNKV